MPAPTLSMTKSGANADQLDLAELETEVNAAFQTLFDGLATTATVGTAVSGAGTKTTPINADTLALKDSQASGALKQVSIASLKTTMRATFDQEYQPRSQVLLATTAAFTAEDKAALDGIPATYQPLQAVLTDTTAAFTTEDKAALDAIPTTYQPTSEALQATTAAFTTEQATKLAGLQNFDTSDPTLSGDVTINDAKLVTSSGDFVLMDAGLNAAWRLGRDGVATLQGQRLPGIDMLAAPGQIGKPPVYTDGGVFMGKDAARIASGQIVGAGGVIFVDADAIYPTIIGQSWVDNNGSNGTYAGYGAALRSTTVLTPAHGRGFNTDDSALGAFEGIEPGREVDPTVQSIVGPLGIAYAEAEERAGRSPLVIASQTGRGGCPIEDLYPAGTAGATGNGQPFENWRQAMIAARNEMSRWGRRLRVPAIWFCQGDGNEDDTPVQYLAKMQVLFPLLQAEAQRITGDWPMMIIIQPPSDATDGKDGPLIAQVDYAMAHDDCIIGAAGWSFAKHDAIHFSSKAALLLGEAQALVLRRLLNGTPVGLEVPTFRERSGDTFIFDYRGPGALRIESGIAMQSFRTGGTITDGGDGYTGGTTVPDAGWEVWTADGATQLTIASLKVLPKSVEITVTSAPASVEVRHAWRSASHGDGGSLNRSNMLVGGFDRSALIPGEKLYFGLPSYRWAIS